MAVRIACSTKTGAEAVREILHQAGDIQPKLVVFFASSRQDLGEVNATFVGACSGARVIGCTTAGEIVSGKMLTGSVVAMLFDSGTVEDAAVAVVQDVQNRSHVTEALQSLESHFGVPLGDLDRQKHVGLVLVDGLSGAEESLMEQVGDYTDISFVGGSAGDDLEFRATYVCEQGRAYRNAAVLALLKLPKGFEIIKTQSFRRLGKRLLATEVNESTRTVTSFDGKPAAEAYAQALGVEVEQLPSYFMNHPLGLMMGEEPYVRSPRQVQGSSVKFYCNIKEGMELELLEAGDIVESTRRAVELDGPVEALLNFHCILRTLELEAKKQCEAYGHVFSHVPTVGFSTYGEEFVGHINQTSTILALR